MNDDLRKYAKLVEGIEQPTDVPVTDVINEDLEQIEEYIDILEEHIIEAIDAAQTLKRIAARSDQISGPFAAQIDAYTVPWLNSFVEDTNQPGSTASLRAMVERSRDDDFDY